MTPYLYTSVITMKQIVPESRQSVVMEEENHLFNGAHHPGHEHDAGGLWRVVHTPEGNRGPHTAVVEART